jgi:hypothetical protein
MTCPIPEECPTELFIDVPLLHRNKNKNKKRSVLY